MDTINPRPKALDFVHVNIPLTMLAEGYVDTFIQNRIRPEIGLDAQAMDSVGLDTCRRIGQAFKQAKLPVTIHGPFIDLSPGAVDQKILAVTRERFEQMFEVTPLFEPIAAVLHLFYMPTQHVFYYDQWLEVATETFVQAADAARNQGVALSIENTYEDGPKPFHDIFPNLPGVGFCLDPGHVAAFSQTPLDVWTREMGPRITHLHLHDNDGSADNHLALGRGTIDLKGVLDYLVATRTPKDRPIVTLEPHTEEAFLESLPALDKLWPENWA